MKHRLPQRLAPPALTLTTALAVLAATAAFAADENVSRSSQDGYPRSSEQAPADLAGTESGYGDANGGAYVGYDTNWFFDATKGEEDVILIRVHRATLDGYGHVKDGDSSSATRRFKEAWGEDRIHFALTCAEDATKVIRVRNKITIHASWVLDGNGRNSMVLKGRALDINGGVLPFDKVRIVSPSVTTTTSTADSTSESASETTTGAAGTTGSGASIEMKNGVVENDESRTTQTVETDKGVAGEDGTATEVSRDFHGTSCDVRIASTELIDLSAQAVADGDTTSARVPGFEIINVVEASYVIDEGGGGAGSPGGNDPSGPTTPGGGTAPGGSGTPGGEPGSPPGGGDGTGPRTPGEEPREPGSEEPRGGDEGDDGAGTLGGGSGGGTPVPEPPLASGG